MTKSKKTPLLWKGVGVRLLPFIIPSKEGNQSLSNYINWIPTYVGIKKDLYPKAVASFKLAIVADFSTSLKMTKSKTSLKMTNSVNVEAFILPLFIIPSKEGNQKT